MRTEVFCAAAQRDRGTECDVLEQRRQESWVTAWFSGNSRKTEIVSSSRGVRDCLPSCPTRPTSSMVHEAPRFSPGIRIKGFGLD